MPAVATLRSNISAKASPRSNANKPPVRLLLLLAIEVCTHIEVTYAQSMTLAGAYCGRNLNASRSSPCDRPLSKLRAEHCLSRHANSATVCVCGEGYRDQA